MEHLVVALALIAVFAAAVLALRLVQRRQK
jgi:hypothetical protein